MSANEKPLKMGLNVVKLKKKVSYFEIFAGIHTLNKVTFNFFKARVLGERSESNDSLWNCL